ncbi:hypothetical protein [Streptomyces huasconensis]|uniref:hypothetical protein n=1 Tax=Streptomyces huasconensis TaxID=1854574 RepID=UPI0033D74C1D
MRLGRRGIALVLGTGKVCFGLGYALQPDPDPRGLAVFGWYATSHVGMILWAAAVPEHSVPHPDLRGRGR